MTVDPSSSVVGEFSHRRVSGGTGLSCVVRWRLQVLHVSYVCVLVQFGDLHLPYPTVVYVGLVCVDVGRSVEVVSSFVVVRKGS